MIANWVVLYFMTKTDPMLSEWRFDSKTGTAVAILWIVAEVYFLYAVVITLKGARLSDDARSKKMQEAREKVRGQPNQAELMVYYCPAKNLTFYQIFGTSFALYLIVPPFLIIFADDLMEFWWRDRIANLVMYSCRAVGLGVLCFLLSPSGTNKWFPFTGNIAGVAPAPPSAADGVAQAPAMSPEEIEAMVEARVKQQLAARAMFQTTRSPVRRPRLEDITDDGPAEVSPATTTSKARMLAMGRTVSTLTSKHKKAGLSEGGTMPTRDDSGLVRRAQRVPPTHLQSYPGTEHRGQRKGVGSDDTMSVSAMSIRGVFNEELAMESEPPTARSDFTTGMDPELVTPKREGAEDTGACSSHSGETTHRKVNDATGIGAGIVAGSIPAETQSVTMSATELLRADLTVDSEVMQLAESDPTEKASRQPEDRTSKVKPSQKGSGKRSGPSKKTENKSTSRGNSLGLRAARTPESPLSLRSLPPLTTLGSSPLVRADRRPDSDAADVTLLGEGDASSL